MNVEQPAPDDGRLRATEAVAFVDDVPIIQGLTREEWVPRAEYQRVRDLAHRAISEIKADPTWNAHLATIKAADALEEVFTKRIGGMMVYSDTVPVQREEVMPSDQPEHGDALSPRRVPVTSPTMPTGVVGEPAPDATDDEAFYARLDPGIRETVRILREHGIETTESCEGTPGHCYPEPTVCFEGTYAAGFHALAVCLDHGLKVASLQRYWNCLGGEVDGPEWRIVFFHPDGGGLHPFETPNGKMRWQWGSPMAEGEPAPAASEPDAALVDRVAEAIYLTDAFRSGFDPVKWPGDESGILAHYRALAAAALAAMPVRALPTRERLAVVLYATFNRCMERQRSIDDGVWFPMAAAVLALLGAPATDAAQE